MVTTFRTSKTVSVSELLAPGSCDGSLKVPKRLLNGTKQYRFGRKNRSCKSFFRNAYCFGIFMTHPVHLKLPKQHRLVITKWYRFGSLTVFLPQFFFRSDWQFTGQKLSSSPNPHAQEIKNMVQK